MTSPAPHVRPPAVEDMVPMVSPVIGSGSAATQLVTVGPWQLTVMVGAQEEEPRIRDEDLAVRLGFERPRKIRDLIKRLVSEKKLNDFDVRPTVGRTRIGIAERNITEYWLTEAATLKLVAKSETDIADAMLDQMIAVFMAARRGLHPVLSKGDSAKIVARLDSLEAENADLRAQVELQGPLGSGVIGEPRAKMYLLAPLREAARIHCANIHDHTDRAFRSTFKDFENQLRLHVGFPQAVAQGWEALPIVKFGAAQGKVAEILGRANRDQKRAMKALREKVKQGILFDLLSKNDGEGAAS